MNFTPLTEEDLKSEKAKELANVYRFMDSTYDEPKKETKLSYKDSIEIKNAINESYKEFKGIILKNLLESVKFFKGKENELSAFIANMLPPPKNIDTQSYMPDLDSMLRGFNFVVRTKLYFSKSEDEVKYDGMFFGRIVSEYESGKLTIDEVNDRCFKYAKKVKEHTYGGYATLGRWDW